MSTTTEPKDFRSVRVRKANPTDNGKNSGAPVVVTSSSSRNDNNNGETTTKAEHNTNHDNNSNNNHQQENTTSTTDQQAQPPTTTTTPTSTARHAEPSSSKPSAPQHHHHAAPKGGVNVRNLDDYPGQPITSPRSLQLLAKYGVHWVELHRRPLNQFQLPDVVPAIAKLRCEHYEARRQKKLQPILIEYDQLPAAAAAPKPRTAASSRPATAGKRTPSAGATPRGGSTTAPRTATPTRKASPTTASSSQQRGSSAPRATSTPRSTTNTTRTQVSRITSGSAAPSIVNTPAVGGMPEARRRALLEKNVRRQQIADRANQLKEHKMLSAEEHLLTEEQKTARALNQQRLAHQVRTEKMRLRHDERRDQVVQLQRIRDYTDQEKAQRWDQKIERSRSVDRYSTLTARERYFTPSQRQDIRRSSTPQRQ